MWFTASNGEVEALQQAPEWLLVAIDLVIYCTYIAEVFKCR